MSHREREHADGSAERGNDWLDGALAGWLLFIAINGGTLAWRSLHDGADWRTSALNVAIPVLAVAAIFPLLRFHRIGWALAFAALGAMVAREGMLLAASAGGWRATAAFLAVDLLGLGYLLWIIPEFWPRHPDVEPSSAPSDGPAPGAEPAEPVSAEPAGPTPVTRALAAIHQRIVAAGSACAVTDVAVRAEAGRFGVTSAALRTEGLSLYRTFLRHFLANGALSAEEERELICLERALDLDDDGVWRLRAEAGLVRGAAPYPASAPEPAGVGDGEGAPPPVVPGAADEDLPPPDAPPSAAPIATGEPAAGEGAPSAEALAIRSGESVSAGTEVAGPDLSAQADVAGSLPRFQSPGLDGGGAAALSPLDEPLPPEEPPSSAEPGSSPDAALPSPPTGEAAAGEGAPSAEALAIRSGGSVPAGTEVAGPDLSAQADVAGSLPRFQSPGLDAGAAAVSSPPNEPLHPDDRLPPDELPSSAEPGSSPDAALPSPSVDALADYEEHELRAALAWAGIGALPAGVSRRRALERLRALHRISTEPLAPCEADVALEPGETCLALRDVQVYVEPAASAPVPNLFGPVLPRRALVDGTLDGERDLSALQRRGACRFILTDRRLLLVTPAGQRSELAVSRVRTVLPYRNGIEVRQQRGAPVFLAFGEGVDDAAMRIDRAAAELRTRA